MTTDTAIRTLAGALTAALVATLVVATSATAAPEVAAGGASRTISASVRHSTLKFGACPAASEAPPEVYCAPLRVPLNYAHPKGRQITLEVSAIGDEDAPRAMIVNPGGPGAAAIGTEQYVWSNLPEKVGEQDEVFSFDPRGVGASTPINCGNLAREAHLKPTPYRPANARQVRARLTQAREIAEGCAKHADRALLASMNVETEARDMDRVRAAIGASTIDYLGYSGGTDLGATYETMFPDRVGRFVLDGVVDPTVSDYASDYEQDPAFQTRAEQFFAWVAARNKTYRLGATRPAVQTTWLRVRRELDRHPLAGTVGSADLDDLLGGAMYLAAEWPDTADLVTNYLHHHDADLIGAAENVESGEPDVGFLAYTCSEPGWPRRWATWQRDTVRAERSAPLFAWLNTWSSAPCLYWPTHVSSEPQIGSVKVRPTLLVSAKYDPATPLVGAQRMHEALATSSLIVTSGGDHAAYLTDPNHCLDAKADRFWLTGELPASGYCAA